MKRIILAVVGAFLLTGCVTYRDLRTQTELDRDADIWTRAHGLRVAMSPDQVKDCSSLGVVSERYYDAPPGDPASRPMGAAWPEYILRFKTAQLGGNAALVSAPIKKWKGELSEWRVLGEAYLCSEPVLTTASHTAAIPGLDPRFQFSFEETQGQKRLQFSGLAAIDAWVNVK